MPTPSQSQHAILVAAAKHPKRDVREFMTHIKIRAVHEKVFQLLLKNGWIEEKPGDPDLAYHLSDLGLEIAGVKLEKKIYTYPKKPAAEKKAVAAKAVKPEGKETKQQKVIDMLKSKEGATIQEIADALNWKKHSAQGFVSGVLRTKLKLTVTTKKVDDRGLVHRIA